MSVARPRPDRRTHTTAPAVAGVGRATALALLLLGGAAHALDLSVDPAGGSLALEDDVMAALADWRAAGVDPDLNDAVVTVSYGPSVRFGPDVQVWVLLRDGSGDATRRFEVLVAPGAGDVRAALIPAFGVVLGGSLGQGAFDPLLDPAGRRRPTTADGAALEARRTALPGDLNGDGRVDFEDLLLLAAAHGQRGVNLAADLDGSGVVDGGDLERLRERYTFEPAALPAAEPEPPAEPPAGDG